MKPEDMLNDLNEALRKDEQSATRDTEAGAADGDDMGDVLSKIMNAIGAKQGLDKIVLDIAKTTLHRQDRAETALAIGNHMYDVLGDMDKGIELMANVLAIKGDDDADRLQGMLTVMGVAMFVAIFLDGVKMLVGEDVETAKEMDMEERLYVLMKLAIGCDQLIAQEGEEDAEEEK